MDDLSSVGRAELERRYRELVARVEAREATLDAIAYKCVDYDVSLSQAESMTGERWPFNEGQQRAGAEIERIIEESGYRPKERPEET